MPHDSISYTPEDQGTKNIYTVIMTKFFRKLYNTPIVTKYIKC